MKVGTRAPDVSDPISFHGSVGVNSLVSSGFSESSFTGDLEIWSGEELLAAPENACWALGGGLNGCLVRAPGLLVIDGDYWFEYEGVVYKRRWVHVSGSGEATAVVVLESMDDDELLERLFQCWSWASENGYMGNFDDGW